MHFATSAMALVASAAAVSAASVTFWTLDDVTRTIHFTPNPGYDAIDAVTVSNKEKHTVTFPDTWIGNYIAVQEGQTNTGNGMLGEVNFNSWAGLTYFDVSAIVDPNDKDNVKQMYPKQSQWPMSGCEVFPCDNAYWHPDDVQTKTTKETDLITTLGTGSTGLTFSASA